MAFAALVVEGAYRELGFDAIVTCADGGKHSNTSSRHYVGAALDFRTNFMTGEQKQTLHAKLVARLGPDFDAVLESTHLHVEHQAKKLPGGGRGMKLVVAVPTHPRLSAGLAHDWYFGEMVPNSKDRFCCGESDCSSREIRFNAETLEFEILINDSWWLATDERWFKGPSPDSQAHGCMLPSDPFP